MSSNRKVRLGIIGCGGVARYGHLPSFSSDPRVEWVVACDLIEERAQSAHDKFGVPHIETDFRKAIDKYELDAVTVCTSNDAHAPVSIYAAEKGLHVMCEKPLALNVTEAEAMLAAVEKAGVVHLIDLSKRFTGHTRWLKTKLEAGDFGQVFCVTVDYFQGYRGDPDCAITWRVQKAKAGAGVMGDLGSHGMDLIRFWAGEPTRIMGYTKTFHDIRPAEDGNGMGRVDCDDIALVTGETERGVAYSMRTTWSRVGSGEWLTAEVYTEKGTILWKMHRSEVMQILYSGNNDISSDLQVPPGYAVNPFELFIDHCISGEQVAEPTFVDGVKLQRIIEAVLSQNA